MSPSLFIESQHSTSPVLSRQWHVGMGLQPPSRKQWEPGPTITLQGQHPPQCLGCSLRFVQTLVHSSLHWGAGLEHLVCKRTCRNRMRWPIQKGFSLRPPKHLTTIKYSFPTFQCITNCHYLPVLDSHLQRFLLGVGPVVGKNLHSEQVFQMILIQGYPGTLGSTSIFLLNFIISQIIRDYFITLWRLIVLVKHFIFNNLFYL